MKIISPIVLQCFSSCACFYFKKRKKLEREKWRMQEHKMMTMDEKNKFFIQQQCKGGKKETFFLYFFGGIRREFSHYMYDNVFLFSFLIVWCSVIRCLGEEKKLEKVIKEMEKHHTHTLTLIYLLFN